MQYFTNNTTNNTLSSLLKMLCMFCLTFTLSLANISAASPQDDSGAGEKVKNYVHKLIEQGKSILNDITLDKASKKKNIRELIVVNLNTEAMMNSALGFHKKSMQPEQLENMAKLYKEYIIQTYTNLVSSYKNQEIQIMNVRHMNGNDFLIQTQIKGSGQPVNVAYLVRAEGDGTYKVIDIITEGISLINTQMAEFDSVINSQGAEQLLKNLTQKIQASKEE
ncbi:putative ABC transporter substrate-binding protein [Rickettsiales endosymbiont of Paramecium tredecaurelia]|uniref:MlaC/ttg2D family ABC transporter substrate-binding protein n=1 Tax=Candidatus Sarmatiella mevalonica TaxID=2770581 RepID=UPI0019222685|nr:ABC transporter substrate-binding protein [Candidatus Sarmatiella mevalonica]MBL3284196.1 putative ABC transporter substrate-binding protein [Candidatus Sarmatiella mevalonica]